MKQQLDVIPKDDACSHQTVFLVDDDEHLREYLKNLLESAGLDVRVYGSAQKFLDLYDINQAGCLVSDIMMPDINGLDFQAMLKDRGIFIPVILISAHGDVSMTKTALKKGALDFIEKPINPIEFLDSVKYALTVDDKQRKKRKDTQAISARLSCLTGRERQILNLLMEGQTNKELASKLCISLRTVETHRNNILKKMHTGSFPELIRTLLSSSLYTA